MQYKSRQDLRTYSVTTESEIVDQIGALRAEIAELKQAEEFMVELLKAKGKDLYLGERYRVAITYGAERKTVQWKTIAERLEPSVQLITANTKTSVYDRVNVSAHKR